MRKRFFWAIFGVAAAVILLVGGAIGLLNRRSAVAATQVEMARAADRVSALISNEDFDAKRPRAALRALLENARDLVGAAQLGIYVITPDGVLRDFAPIDRAISSHVELLSKGELDIQLQRDDGRQIFVHAQPVKLPSSRITPVIVLVREEPVSTGLPLGGIAMAGLLAAVLAGVASSMLSGQLARRLGGLASAAAAVSTGDLSARAEVTGRDEVAAVATTFNHMVDELTESRAREREFLIAVGHELRTPLTTMFGYAEALEAGAITEGDGARIGKVLGNETNRLRRLIDDLMLLARLGTDEFRLRPEPVDVRSHLNELIAGFKQRAGSVGVDVEADIEDTKLRMVDPDRIGQVVGNLIDNAIRLTPEAGIVRVACRPIAERLQIVVSDTGPGIDPGDLPHVFERFYVARKYRQSRPEGSGLGLAIVKSLIDAMGGEVSVTVPPSGGTTVTAVIPAPAA